MTGKLSILGKSGHDSVTWDKGDRGSVAVAEREFNTRVKGQKAAAFEMLPDGSTKERVYDFNPEAFEVIVVPSLQGG